MYGCTDQLSRFGLARHAGVSSLVGALPFVSWSLPRPAPTLLHLHAASLIPLTTSRTPAARLSSCPSFIKRGLLHFTLYQTYPYLHTLFCIVPSSPNIRHPNLCALRAPHSLQQADFTRDILARNTQSRTTRSPQRKSWS